MTNQIEASKVSESESLVNQIEKRAKRGKPKARGNGNGTVWQLKSGNWCWQATIDGRKRSGTVKTKTEAERALKQLFTDHERGVLSNTDKVKFQDYALKWLELQTQIRPNTQKLYGEELRLTFPHIGRFAIKELRATHIKDMLVALSKTKTKNGKVFASRTLKMVLTRLRAVLREAVIDNVIFTNPALGVKPVKSANDEPERGVALEYVQAERLIDLGTALHGAGLCRLWCGIYTALTVGLRRGEVMGLRWCDVNLEKCILSVRHNYVSVRGVPHMSKPKTKSGERDIPIPLSLLGVLQQHKDTIALERQKLGLPWDVNAPVFATELGTFTHPDNLERALSSLLEWSNPNPIQRKGKKGVQVLTLEQRLRSVPLEFRERIRAVVESGEALPRISPHDLRHTAGTWMLRRRMPLEVVSKILGHAKVSITLDVYRHVLESEKQQEMVDLFPNPVSSRAVRAVPLN
jgi:integrase